MKPEARGCFSLCVPVLAHVCVPKASLRGFCLNQRHEEGGNVSFVNLHIWVQKRKGNGPEVSPEEYKSDQSPASAFEWPASFQNAHLSLHCRTIDSQLSEAEVESGIKSYWPMKTMWSSPSCWEQCIPPASSHLALLTYCSNTEDPVLSGRVCLDMQFLKIVRAAFKALIMGNRSIYFSFSQVQGSYQDSGYLKSQNLVR